MIFLLYLFAAIGLLTTALLVIALGMHFFAPDPYTDWDDTSYEVEEADETTDSLDATTPDHA